MSSLSVENAAAILSAGDVVALPTETVYGLAADATDDRAVAKIYALKDRPAFNPLIVHVADAASAKDLVVVEQHTHILMDRFWPGPLTLVLPRKEACPVGHLASAGLKTLGVRCPDHALSRAVIRALGKPIAAPSANPSGKLSPTTAAHVREGFGKQAPPILDGGPCRAGLESTIIGKTEDGWALLRPGPITVEDLQPLTGPLATPGPDITAPGQLASHYAPSRPLRMTMTEAPEGWVLVGFGPIAGDVSLSASGNLEEAAANLFLVLHEADRPAHAGIAVAPIPAHGLGLAINDRLTRAAAGWRGDHDAAI